MAEATTSQESLSQEEKPIVFYCKDCEILTDGIKLHAKYVYKCAKCGTKNVAFGTLKSIKNFYHLEGEDKNHRAVPIEQ
jgi:Zn finger protein HypA/HybF involved in hydrogenase expression